MTEVLKSKTMFRKGRFTITKYMTLNEVYYRVHFFKSWFFPIGFPLTEQKYKSFKNAEKDLETAYKILSNKWS